MVIYHHRAFLKTKCRFQLSIRWVIHAEHGWVISGAKGLLALRLLLLNDNWPLLDRLRMVSLAAELHLAGIYKSRSIALDLVDPGLCLIHAGPMKRGSSTLIPLISGSG
jgi:hypothetical protein